MKLICTMPARPNLPPVEISWDELRRLVLAAGGQSEDTLDLKMMALETKGEVLVRVPRGEIKVARVNEPATMGERLMPGCTCGATAESNRCRCD